MQKVSIPKADIQLVGLATMFLVSKYEEIQPYSIKEFAYVSADSCTIEQIRVMEKKILVEIDYQFGKPFSLQFLRRYSKIQNATVLQHNMAKYILEQSLLDATLSSVKPSLKAAAALQLSLQLLDNGRKPSYDYWSDTMRHQRAIQRWSLSKLDIS